MARRFMIAGNWKLHKTVEESLALARGVREGLARNDLDVLLAPTFPALYPVARELAGSPIRLGAQNLYWENQGAFTGEVSGPLIKAAGASHVIVGHSERRQYFGETEKTVALRLAAALAAGLAPILCVGESLGEREAGATEAVLESQLAGGLAGFPAARAAELILAYEPVWAIGTGKVASEAQANQAHAFIRSCWPPGSTKRLRTGSESCMEGVSSRPMRPGSWANRRWTAPWWAGRPCPPPIFWGSSPPRRRVLDP